MLVQHDIARVRVAQAPLWLQRSGRHALRHNVLAEVENALRELRRALEASRVPVARPHELGEGCSARPHFGADDGVVDLLGPKRRDGAEDLIRVDRVLRKIVVVDALPRLVWRTPRATRTAVVEVERLCARVRVSLYVVLRVVAEPAAEAAVEIHEVGARHDDLVAHLSQIVDVVHALVPRLHDDVLGHRVRGPRPAK